MWKAYLKWLKEVTSKRIYEKDKVKNSYFEAIVRLGVPALPYVIQKIDEEPVLWRAVRAITKREFDFQELQKAGWDSPALYLEWWKYGRRRTPYLFEKRYKSWKELLKEGEKREPEKQYERIVGLGVGILPYAMERIKEGEVELIGVVSEITDGALPRNSSTEGAIRWWLANKKSWLLPPCVPTKYTTRPKDYNPKRLFEKRYKEWKSFMNSVKARGSPDARAKSQKHFRAIVELGVPALPYIVDRATEEPSLWEAVRMISKREFTAEELRKAVGEWKGAFIEWWRDGRLHLEEEFEKLYSERSKKEPYLRRSTRRYCD